MLHTPVTDAKCTHLLMFSCCVVFTCGFVRSTDLPFVTFQMKHVHVFWNYFTHSFIWNIKEGLCQLVHKTICLAKTDYCADGRSKEVTRSLAISISLAVGKHLSNTCFGSASIKNFTGTLRPLYEYNLKTKPRADNPRCVKFTFSLLRYRKGACWCYVEHFCTCMIQAFFTAVVMSSYVFWDITACSLLKVNMTMWDYAPNTEKFSFLSSDGDTDILNYISQRNEMGSSFGNMLTNACSFVVIPAAAAVVSLHQGCWTFLKGHTKIIGKMFLHTQPCSLTIINFF
jgi:hypothetical protein